MTPAYPHWEVERRLWAQGWRWVAGVDEAGRGAWAGPVTAAAVVFAPAMRALPCLRDSKTLSPRQREACAQRIRRQAVAWAVGWAAPREVDAVGVVEATRRAMGRALAGLGVTPQYVLVDHLTLPDVPWPQFVQPKADAHIATVAAASILAKVARDAYMRAISPAFPGFDFGRHKGYGTAAHRRALARYGPTALHRRSFRPVLAAGQGGSRFTAPGP